MRWQLENGEASRFFFSMGKHTVLKCVQYTHKNDYGKVGGSVGRARKELIMEERTTESRECMGFRVTLRVQILWRYASSENMR